MAEYSKYSPVALFIYNRPEHARRTVESLLANPEISETPVTVYCDGPKDEKDSKNVNKARAIVRFLLPEVIMVERKYNIGLANSIIGGVDEQCSKYGKVIVFEDDVIVAPTILKYLNTALDFYESYEKVMHITGYMYPLKVKLPQTFFYRVPTPAGPWATWRRAWKYFEHDPHIIVDYLNKKGLIEEFGQSHSLYYWSILQAQCQGRVDSWFICWYGTLFMKKALALHPGKSLAKNIGFDGSGTHCSKTNAHDVNIAERIPSFTDEIVECDLAVRAMYKFRTRINRDLFRYRKRRFLQVIRFITGKFNNN